MDASSFEKSLEKRASHIFREAEGHLEEINQWKN